MLILQCILMWVRFSQLTCKHESGNLCTNAERCSSVWRSSPVGSVFSRRLRRTQIESSGRCFKSIPVVERYRTVQKVCVNFSPNVYGHCKSNCHAEFRRRCLFQFLSANSALGELNFSVPPKCSPYKSWLFISQVMKFELDEYANFVCRPFSVFSALKL